MAMAALIPGLKVKVEGVYNEHRQVLATSIKFKGGDLEDAQKVQAGMHQTKMQAQQNKEELERQTAELQAQRAALEKQQALLAEQQAKIAANKAAIEANVARFGQLDDYYIFDELTVYFANGQVKVDPKYDAQLLALVEKSKTNLVKALRSGLLLHFHIRQELFCELPQGRHLGRLLFWGGP